jgi:hypothetical protein
MARIALGEAELRKAACVPKCDLGTREARSEKASPQLRSRTKKHPDVGSYPAFYVPAMNATQQTLTDTVIDSRRLIAGLRQALDINYARLLATAQTRWEQNFAGKDPSDACVTVRISSGKPLAAILKKTSRSLLHGATQRLLA